MRITMTMTQHCLLTILLPYSQSFQLCVHLPYTVMAINLAGGAMGYVCTFVSVVSVGLCVYTLKKEELLSIQ